jgi:hypothetical protein
MDVQALAFAAGDRASALGYRRRSVPSLAVKDKEAVDAVSHKVSAF